MNLLNRFAHLWSASGWAGGLAVAAVLQTLVLGWMVWDRISILRADAEITLTPEPIDPRDLFRGDYVILRYGISRPPSDVDRELRGPVWAVIALGPPDPDDDAPDTAQAWRVVSVTEDRPKTLPDGAVLLRATAQHYGSLTYGLERYYVPEGAGLDLERRVGERAVKVRIAIDDDGRAAIKGLTVDGETVFEEPWF